MVNARSRSVRMPASRPAPSSTMSVPQAMSGSGARYANADESFVFWNKGDDAFITEGDPDKPTFADCVDATKKT